MPTHRKPTSWLFANFETISLWTPECEFSRVSSNPLTRRKIFAEMVVTDLFDEGLQVTSIYDQKKHYFSDDFHGIWESLIFDSDVKAQVRNTLIFLTCVVFDIEITIVIFSSLSFLLQLINYAMTTLLFSDRHGITLIFLHVFYTLDKAKLVI